ncbi:hypothetical protein ACFC26_21895 [Kitasatospora purpeofusca]|uniref:hypothetical protein n=1 Tax=Kitasatospora purpeofusca TaxID=67352 RepID=UPI0035D7CE0A
MTNTSTPDPELEPVTLVAGPREFTAFARVAQLNHHAEADFFGPTEGLLGTVLFAEIQGATPMTFKVSRLLGEVAWYVDSVIGANGFPHLDRPFGSGRGLAGHLAGQSPTVGPATPFVGVLPGLVDLLDREAVGRELVDRLGPGVPLHLAATR